MQNLNTSNNEEPADRIRCALVMPAYNERACIATVLTSWMGELGGQFDQSFKLIVVDDGSKDETGGILDRLASNEPALLVEHQANAGHGAALMNGYRKALSLNPDYVFHVDSDDQFDAADFGKLWTRKEESKFIIGYRAARLDPFHRIAISRALRFVVALVFGVKVKDLNIPFRLIKADYLRALLEVLPSKLFAPNILLSILAARDRQRLLNIPVTHHNRRTGTVSLVRWSLIKGCLAAAGDLLRLRLGLAKTLHSLKAFER